MLYVICHSGLDPESSVLLDSCGLYPDKIGVGMTAIAAINVAVNRKEGER